MPQSSLALSRESRQVMLGCLLAPTVGLIAALIWGRYAGVIAATVPSAVLVMLTLRQFHLAVNHPLRTFMLGVGIGTIFSTFGEFVTLYWVASTGHMYFPNLFHMSMVGWLLFLPFVLSMTPSRRELGRRDPVTSTEGMMIGATLCLAAWLVLGAVIPGVGTNFTSTLLVVNSLSRFVVIAYCAIVTARDYSEQRWLTTACIGGVQIVDLVMLYFSYNGHSYPIYMPLLSCLLWGLFTESLTGPQNYSEFSNIEQRARVEMRQSIVASLLLYGAVMACVVATLVRFTQGTLAIDPTIVVLLIVVVSAGVVREVIRARENRQLTTALVKSASTDVLTGLGNRRALSAFLDALTRGDHPKSFDLMVLDLDGFKEVNTRFGHTRGDELLVAAAGAISATAQRRGAHCARLGGDEFCVVLPQGGLDPIEFGHEIIDDLSAAITAIDGAMQVRISASCGVAHWDPSDGEPLLTLNLAAEALKVAKTRGRASVVRYSSELAAQALRTSTLKNRLRAALGTPHIEAHVQPIFALNGLVPVGMEALARWTDDELGRIRPDEFITVAEESGLIHPLGLEILRKAIPIYLASGLRESGGRLWLNVSTIQLRVEGYTEQVRSWLLESGLDLPNIVIEVTESVLVRRDDPALREVRKLAAGGAQIAVDDFGTGYASASYINRLPISILKFDASLVAEVDSHVGRSVVNALLNLAHALDVSVVLEGIEDAEIDLHVRRLEGSDDIMVQGWHYARPTHLGSSAFTEIFGDSEPAA
ncbi:bifunctional diguanylate cyclase/phosphodiesterase [Micrococcales bacterium 31B]|nr:bifunctional diguanylate cyclase/phosphodiesterase [Micrococcales bacterium 31B]